MNFFAPCPRGLEPLLADELIALGATDPSYTDAMFARETQVSTFMGNGVAIPHGTN